MSKKIATVRLINEVQAAINGVSPRECKELSDEFSFFANNYFFNPEFQLERWDGKTKFFTPGGVTYIEMLPDVLFELKDMGYSIKLKDERKPFDLVVEKIGKDYFSEYGWTIADHQLKAINAVTENNHKGIIKVGTGGGKTLITAILADLYRNKGKRIIIIVPNKDLIEQTKEEIEQFGIEVGAYYQKEKNLRPAIVVSTWQSLGRNPRILHDFDGFMVDEAHGIKANVLQNLLCGDTGKNMPIRIGLTGTLPDHDTDKLTVFCALGQVVSEVRSEQLISEGWLAKLNLTMLGFKEDFKEEYEQFKNQFKDDPKLKDVAYAEFKRKYLFPEYQNEKSYLIHNSDRMETLALMIQKTTEKYGNSFVLVNSVDFGKKLSKLIGDNAIFISSSIKDRKPIYKSFDESNGIVGIATFNLASTGLNIPRLFNVFVVDGGKSSVRVVQTIGRGLRKAVDKDQVNVIDVYSSVVFSTKHAAKRKKIYKEEKYAFTELKSLKYEEKTDREKTVQNLLKTIKSLRYDSKLENEVFD